MISICFEKCARLEWKVPFTNTTQMSELSRLNGYTQMKSALEKAGFFSDTTPHKLIMLGDLFDRGHEAKHLQQFVLKQMEQDRAILIRGNHEDLFAELVTTDAGMPYGHHKSNGTYDTAIQLTGFDPVMASIRHYDFADAAKDTPFYKEIIMMKSTLSLRN